MYLLKKHKNNYDFLCETYYVEYTSNCYHIFKNCYDIENDIIKVKGYELTDTINLCEHCKTELEDIEDGIY